MKNSTSVNIIGAGLAGSEAAYQLAEAGIKVKLYEMRGDSQGSSTPAHQTTNFSELVCSNSFRSDELTNAVGLLHQEMRMMGSLIMQIADKNRLPAGAALAVDREVFAQNITDIISSHPNIEVIRQEKYDIDPNQYHIIASGPLTSDKLSQWILSITDQQHLAFFDAIAPIVYTDSIDFSKAWYQSRYDKGSGKDYINCPLSKTEYDQLIAAILAAPKIEFKEWEVNTPYFNGCMPIEVMAERGPQTLRFGPMKPVGLTNPHNPSQKPYAVVQLRQDNKDATLYNIVGFQTKMRYGSQQDIFRMIPGLEGVEFARMGGLHRNTFINSPKLLADNMSLKTHNKIRFAGQITGVEGYLESAAIGLLVGLSLAAQIHNKEFTNPPRSTSLGALVAHITSQADVSTFQPMNANFGLFSELDDEDLYFINSKGRKTKLKGQEKKLKYVQRGLHDIGIWCKNYISQDQ